MEENLRWKTILDGRRPSMEDKLPWMKIFNGKQPSIEDDIFQNISQK